jgi:hypothetical protein
MCRRFVADVETFDESCLSAVRQNRNVTYDANKGDVRQFRTVAYVSDQVRRAGDVRQESRWRPCFESTAARSFGEGDWQLRQSRCLDDGLFQVVSNFEMMSLILSNASSAAAFV